MEGVNKFVMDYGNKRALAYKKQNKLNRERAKRMEKYVSQYLGGNRVPMSGAGFLKGDGLVYFDKGLYLIECKFSSMRNSKNQVPKIRLDFRWLTKLEDEVKAMRARFGILVFHYRCKKGNYVIMRLDWFREYINPIVKIHPGYTIMSSGINMEHEDLESRMAENVISLTIPQGEYVIMMIEDFKTWLDVMSRKAMNKEESDE